MAPLFARGTDQGTECRASTLLNEVFVQFATWNYRVFTADAILTADCCWPFFVYRLLIPVAGADRAKEPFNNRVLDVFARFRRQRSNKGVSLATSRTPPRTKRVEGQRSILSFHQHQAGLKEKHPYSVSVICDDLLTSTRI